MHQMNLELRKGPVSLRLSFILLGLLLCASSVSAQDKFGYVLDVRGDWVLNSSVKLSKGSSVTVGGVVTTPSPTDGGTYIVIADRNGNIFDRRSCANSGECNRPIKIPAASAGEQSLTSRIIGAAMALVSNQPAKYASLVSRGTDLQEAVVKLEGDQVDLSAVFKNMQGDRYLLRFEQMSKKVNISRGRSPEPLKFTWDPKKPQPLVAKELVPGLYKVSLLEVSLLESDAGAHDPTGNEAWVFVARPDQYPKASSTFDAATQVTKQWGTNVRQNTVREFLRASLDFINAQNAQ
jgi:hypothetical protein